MVLLPHDSAVGDAAAAGIRIGDSTVDPCDRLTVAQR